MALPGPDPGLELELLSVSASFKVRPFNYFPHASGCKRTFRSAACLRGETDFAGERQCLCLTKRFDIRRQNACASYQN
jgi:hypothetical protein